ncbi:unnamed protein product [Protopolystoma xenopodis]|uniref:Uncharacterized protein n=1 Tax=Protopolystoma xenopodis TaxID=117903 RepID=A0A3S5APZ4_9PLAT|nr:unnamed protein product [Protopolystoma xenopodis]
MSGYIEQSTGALHQAEAIQTALTALAEALLAAAADGNDCENSKPLEAEARRC